MQTFGRSECIRIALVASALLAAGCQRTDSDQHSNSGAAGPSGKPPPIVEPSLDREQLLLIAARAASAAALGEDDRGAQREVEGDPFEIRLRFGCRTSGPSVPNGPLQIRYDDESQRLQITAFPDLMEDPRPGPPDATEIEAVEGFWMRKPWLLAPGCPVPAGQGPEAPDSSEAPGQPSFAEWKVGIAQFFAATESRTGRRDRRAYEATKTISPSQDFSKGFDLVLSGRLRALPDGKVVTCQVMTRELPPECVVSVKFDQVRIENAATQELLAEWHS